MLPERHVSLDELRDACRPLRTAVLLRHGGAIELVGDIAGWFDNISQAAAVVRDRQQIHLPPDNRIIPSGAPGMREAKTPPPPGIRSVAEVEAEVKANMLEGDTFEEALQRLRYAQQKTTPAIVELRPAGTQYANTRLGDRTPWDDEE